MSYTVATVPKGFAIAFPTEKKDDVSAANGYVHLLDACEYDTLEEAIKALEKRNEEIEQKRSSSLVIISQGLKTIVTHDGDMNQILAALTKFICETMSKGGFTFSQIDRMIDLVMEHMDNLAEQQSKTFNDLKDAIENPFDDMEVFDDDELL